MSNREENTRMETKSSRAQIEKRNRIAELYRETPIPEDQLLVNLGLYMRSSALVKILFINELFELIRDIPGIIVEFGTWWGQNLVLAENLRAIHEPFNQTRRIIGFDTFSGYTGFSDVDRPADYDETASFAEAVQEGGYAVSKGYKRHLEDLMAAHEGNNILGNIKKHTLIEGDVVETVPHFFKQHPENVVALAYFDLALYKPTRICLEAIKPHLIPGSVILLDEFNFVEAPGETIAFKEVFKDTRFTIRKSRFIPDRSIVVIQ